MVVPFYCRKERRYDTRSIIILWRRRWRIWIEIRDSLGSCQLGKALSVCIVLEDEGERRCETPVARSRGKKRWDEWTVASFGFGDFRQYSRWRIILSSALPVIRLCRRGSHSVLLMPLNSHPSSISFWASHSPLPSSSFSFFIEIGSSPSCPVTSREAGTRNVWHAAVFERVFEAI